MALQLSDFEPSTFRFRSALLLRRASADMVGWGRKRRGRPCGDIHARGARYFLEIVAVGNDRYLTVNMTYLSYFRHSSFILSAKSSGRIVTTSGKGVRRRST